MRDIRYCLFVTFLTLEGLSVSTSSEENQQMRHGTRLSHIPDMRWDVWTRWSQCSVDCGTGMMTRSRDCRSTTDGQMVEGCPGQNKEIKLCKITGCIRPTNTLSVCKHLETRVYGGKRYRWKPYKHPIRPCELACRPVAASFYLGLRKNVPDGTTCGKKNDKVCVHGKCQSVGCDDVVESTAVMDTCGVCNGDDSTCKQVSEVFVDKVDFGYHSIGTIPRGARNIAITESSEQRNYLAVKSADDTFRINTNFQLSRFGEHPGASTVFTYNRRAGPNCPDECILAEGPTDVDIEVMVLIYTDNKGVKFSYTVPTDTVIYGSMEEKSPPMVYIDGGTIPASNEESAEDEQKRPIFSHDFKYKKSYKRHHKHKQNKDKNRHSEFEDSDDTDRDIVTGTNTSNNDSVNINIDRDSNTTVTVSRERQGEHVNNKVDSNIDSDQDTTERNAAMSRNNTIHVSENDADLTINPAVETTSPPSSTPTTGASVDSAVTPGFEAKTPGIAEDDFGGNVYLNETSTEDDDEDGPSEEDVPDKTDVDLDTDVSGEKNESRNGTDTGDGDSGTGPDALEPQANRAGDAGGPVGDMYTNDNTIPSLYSWREAGYTTCSQTCGQGKMSAIIECIVTDKLARVDDRFCSVLEKPETTTEPCNYGPCPPSWQSRPWGKCSVTCDIGVQTRDHICKRPDGTVVSGYECGYPGPRREERTCDMGSCTTGWYFTKWETECPVDCGQGTQERQVYCSSDAGNAYTSCPERERPQTERSCRGDVCKSFWLTGPWSKCNATCGVGFQTRPVACAHRQRDRVQIVSAQACKDEEKPATYMSCDLEPCKPEWYMNNWGECSVSCGTGQRSRDIRCLDSDQIPSSDCDPKTKPADRETCSADRPCPVADQRRPKPTQRPDKPAEIPADCKDKFSQCSLVLQARLCQYKYYAKICCRSCAKILNT